MIIELEAFDRKLHTLIEAPIAWGTPVFNLYWPKPLSLHQFVNTINLTTDYAGDGIVRFFHTGKYRKVPEHEIDLAGLKLDPTSIQLMYMPETFIEYGTNHAINVPTYELDCSSIQQEAPALPAPAKILLTELYTETYAEACIEPFSDLSQTVVQPLLKKLEKLNELLHFSAKHAGALSKQCSTT